MQPAPAVINDVIGVEFFMRVRHKERSATSGLECIREFILSFSEVEVVV